MVNKSTLSVALGIFFALAVAMPASATTVVTDVATVDTDAETTSVTTNQATVKTTGTSFDVLLAQMRAKLAAKKATSTKATTTPRTLGTALKTASSSCIMKLVDAREVAIQNAWATFNLSMTDALKARHSALMAAWGKEDVTVRAQDIKVAMKTWQEAHKGMFTKLKTARKTAWATFKANAKSECKVTVPSEEKLSSDATGSVSL